MYYFIPTFMFSSPLPTFSLSLFTDENQGNVTNVNASSVIMNFTSFLLLIYFTCLASMTIQLILSHHYVYSRYPGLCNVQRKLKLTSNMYLPQRIHLTLSGEDAGFPLTTVVSLAVGIPLLTVTLMTVVGALCAVVCRLKRSKRE